MREPGAVRCEIGVSVKGEPVVLVMQDEQVIVQMDIRPVARSPEAVAAGYEAQVSQRLTSRLIGLLEEMALVDPKQILAVEAIVEHNLAQLRQMAQQTPPRPRRRSRAASSPPPPSA